MPKQSARSHSLTAGRLGVGSIVFMVLAAVAPLSATVAIVPLAIGLGNGIGAPGAWLLAGVVLMLFAVGYAAMSRYIKNAGGFYAYVSQGLGRPAGVATAFLAIVAYNAMMISVTAIFTVFAQEIIGALVGIHVPWQAWLVFILVVIGALAWRGVDVSAMVLGIALVLEMGLLLVLDVAILASEGFGAFTLDVFNPTFVFGSASGIAILLAFSTFIGFEQTAIYSEEAKNPLRTVPRATFIAIGTVTVFYLLTSWALIAGYGADHAAAAAAENPEGFFFAANSKYLGGWADTAIQILVLVSMFAAVLSLHNATARYFYSMGRNRLLPYGLSRTRKTTGTPHIATLTQLTVTGLIIAPFAFMNADPYLGVGAAAAGLGALSVIISQCLTAAAVIGYFRRRGDTRWFTTLIAPALGGLGLAFASVLAIGSFSALTGVEGSWINELRWLPFAVGLGGLAYGYWLRANRPEIYRLTGQNPAEDAEPGDTADLFPHAEPTTTRSS